MQKKDFIHSHTSISTNWIQNTLKLLDEGATVPFIARYRKEMTNGLDEVEIAAVRDSSKKFDELISRQSTILNAIEEHGKLTEELREKITQCFDPIVLEDLYLPYKQKRQTKGEKARKHGLEPLAKMIMSQRGGDPQVMAEKFVKGEVESEEMAISGAKDIIAEWINENTQIRSRLRQLFQRKSVVISKLVKGKDEEAAKYKDYFDFSEPLFRCASHRLLALIRIKCQPNSEEGIELIEKYFVKSNDLCSEIVAESCKESYKRLIYPSLENEVLNEAKEKADKEAIKVFSTNLRQLLLAPPLGSKRILAIDPGFRTGCKVVCLDESGKLLMNQTIYPHAPQNESSAARSKLAQWVQAYKLKPLPLEMELQEERRKLW